MILLWKHSHFELHLSTASLLCMPSFQATTSSSWLSPRCSGRGEREVASFPSAVQAWCMAPPTCVRLLRRCMAANAAMCCAVPALLCSVVETKTGQHKVDKVRTSKVSAAAVQQEPPTFALMHRSEWRPCGPLRLADQQRATAKPCRCCMLLPPIGCTSLGPHPATSLATHTGHVPAAGTRPRDLRHRGAGEAVLLMPAASCCCSYLQAAGSGTWRLRRRCHTHQLGVFPEQRWPSH